MATFTSRPVKAGLPTLFELQGAAPEELQRMQVIASVAIADELSEVVEQLKRLAGRREAALGASGLVVAVTRRRNVADACRTWQRCDHAAAYMAGSHAKR